MWYRLLIASCPLRSAFVEVIARIRCHHLRRKDFVVAAGDLQVTVSRIGLKEKSVPWVRCDRKALFDSNV